jgi:hypothetical protein
VDRTALLWTLVVLFGASLMFATIRNATEDKSIGVTLGVQALAGLAVIGAIVLIVRRRG